MIAIGVGSLLISIVSYLGFLLFCSINWYRRVTGRALFLASLATLAWILCIAYFGYSISSLIAESVAILGWTFLLVRALGLSVSNRQEPRMLAIGRLLTISAVITIALIAIATASLFTTLTIPNWIWHSALLINYVIGTILVEQLARNTRLDLRWRTRYLTIAMGMVFGYSILLHALAVLRPGGAVAINSLQPLVFAASIPFLVLASLRNKTNQLRFSLSRNFVFRTGVLVSVGLFLVALGLFGYIAQLFAGEIGLSIAVFTTVVSLAGVFIALGSVRLRRQLKVVLSKTFFEYRYDYRDEWMRVTSHLTEPDVDFDLEQQAQRAINDLLQSDRSGLWRLSDEQRLLPASQLNSPDWHVPIDTTTTQMLIEFYLRFDWVIDLESPAKETQKVITSVLESSVGAGARFVVPLFVDNKLLGIIISGSSESMHQLNWEDFDIVKLVAKQSAGFLAFEQASKALAEQTQLNTMSQISAFLIHDVKTVAAQLSLMQQNAHKHRHNPAFVDDMLTTVDNSVNRLNRVIESLRQPSSEGTKHSVGTVNLNLALEQLIDRFPLAREQIVVATGPASVLVNGSVDKIVHAAHHIVQNALEAAGENARIDMLISEDEHWGYLHIQDNGPGMSQDFLNNELFSPFRTSKGLSGMGIGAYQARTTIRQMGGDLLVESKPDHGSKFSILLPRPK